MRHARHTHDAGLAGNWPTLTIWSSAVGGAVLAFAGGGSMLAYTGVAVAAGAAVAGGTVIHLRQSACAANAEVIAAARAKDKDEYTAELERRDLKVTRLDDELTAVRERGVVLRRQLGELSERLNDEKLHRIAASEERDRALTWAGNELARATETLEATREELERATLRAASAEFELAELERSHAEEEQAALAKDASDTNAADAEAFDTTAFDADAVRPALPTAAEFAATRAALAAVWAAAPEPEVLARSLEFGVTEPLTEPYLVPEAVSIPAQGGAPSGLRRYLLADDTAEIDLTAIDLTAYDETTEFSVRQLRDEEAARTA